LILTDPLPPKLPPVTRVEGDAGSVAVLCRFATGFCLAIDEGAQAVLENFSAGDVGVQPSV
jgi:hypothetical protein